MIHPDLFPFFRKLGSHNSKKWFEPHKPKYKEMHAVFADALEELAVDVASFDDRVAAYLESPKAVKVFRIYRDTRFQKSPIPLKTNVSGLVSSGPDGPFYYVQTGPGDSMAGGGIYLPPAPLLLAIREEISDSHEELDAILHDPAFVAEFPEGLKTEFEVKTTPRGFPKDHVAIEHLRKKSFTVTRQFTDAEVTSPDFPGLLLDTFQALEPLNRYLSGLSDVCSVLGI